MLINRLIIFHHIILRRGGAAVPPWYRAIFLLINGCRYRDVSIIVYCQTGNSCPNSLKVVSVNCQTTNPDIYRDQILNREAS